MSTQNWLLSARSPLCLPADALYRTGQVIFHNLSGAVTPDRINAAQEALETYRAELLPKLHPMHYGMSVGMHVCVEEVYQEAKARLRALAATSQPAPEPPAPPPAATPQPVRDDALIANMETWLASRASEPTPADTPEEEETR
jgi:hypothetical protein